MIIIITMMIMIIITIIIIKIMITIIIGKMSIPLSYFKNLKNSESKRFMGLNWRKRYEFN